MIESFSNYIEILILSSVFTKCGNGVGETTGTRDLRTLSERGGRSDNDPQDFAI